MALSFLPVKISDLPIECLTQKIKPAINLCESTTFFINLKKAFLLNFTTNYLCIWFTNILFSNL